MPTGTVQVRGPHNLLLCVNGNYHPDFPQFATYTFTVEYGVNRFEARSAASFSLDGDQATPGIFDMLGGVVGSSIDNASGGTVARLRSALHDDFLAAATELRQQGHPDLAANLEAVVNHTVLVEVDFDAIADAACRNDFHNISTSWTNSNDEINGLMLVGPALLTAPRVGLPSNYERLLAETGGVYSDPAHHDRPPNLTEACAALRGQATEFTHPGK